jgi:hypothetical protein
MVAGFFVGTQKWSDSTLEGIHELFCAIEVIVWVKHNIVPMFGISIANTQKAAQAIWLKRWHKEPSPHAFRVWP